MTHRKPKVIVAMSGGVDSSVAACLLHEQGYDVTGLFMRTGVHEEEPVEASCVPDRHRGCCSAADASDARAVAGRLGVPFFALNFKEQFDQIIDYFADEYTRGRTPNPCVMCNEHLKFGRLADYGAAAGADFVATGHYARIGRHGEDYRLLRGVDSVKDQSYVLFGIAREMLSRTLFPLGELTKEQVREEARRFGLAVSEKPDSVDICFVPDRAYARVVRERRPEAFVPGSIVNEEGREIGRHEGIPSFTIGQRRGLGVAVGLPIYVTYIDSQTHTITVGPKQSLAHGRLRASRVRWLTDLPAEPFRAFVQIRYSHKAAPAVVTPIAPDQIEVAFDDPQNAVTPGQAAVIYNGDTVLAGGWID